MALIHDEEEVLGEVVHEGEGSTSRRTSRKYTRVVLYAGTVADLAYHLHIVVSALFYALSFDEFIVLLEVVDTLGKLSVYLLEGIFELVIAYDVVRCRENSHMADNGFDFAGDNVYLGDAVDLVAEVLHTDSRIARPRGEYLDNVSAYSEPVTLKGDVVALVAYADELGNKLVARFFGSLTYRDAHRAVFVRASERVNARYARYDDDVSALCKGSGSGVPQLVYLVVY